MKKILGLDVSTSITGYTIVDENGKILEQGALDTRNPNHFPDFWSKCEAAEKLIKDLNSKHTFDSVWIEQSLQTFKSGFSSAQTLSTLSKFNGIFSWFVVKEMKQKPNYIMAVSARKLNGIKVPRGQVAKEVVMKHLLDNEPNFKVEYTRQGNPSPKYFDIADSIVVARAGSIKCMKKS